MWYFYCIFMLVKMSLCNIQFKQVFLFVCFLLNSEGNGL